MAGSPENITILKLAQDIQGSAQIDYGVFEQYCSVDEGRKRVVGIIAGILVARHLKTTEELFDTRESPRSRRRQFLTIETAGVSTQDPPTSRGFERNGDVSPMDRKV